MNMRTSIQIKLAIVRLKHDKMTEKVDDNNLGRKKVKHCITLHMEIYMYYICDQITGFKLMLL